MCFDVQAEPILWSDEKVRNTRLNGLRVQPEGTVVLIGHCHPLSLLSLYCLLFSAFGPRDLSGRQNDSEML